MQFALCALKVKFLKAPHLNFFHTNIPAQIGAVSINPIEITKQIFFLN